MSRGSSSGGNRGKKRSGRKGYDGTQRGAKPVRSHGRDRSPQRGGDEGRARSRFKTEKPEVPSLNFSGKHRWVAGIHSCRETLKVRPHSVQKVFFKQGADRSDQFKEILQLLDKNHIDHQEVLSEQLDQLTSGHQGIALSTNEDPQVDWKELETADSGIVLFLDGIEDPHNLGAILRTAWLMGVKAIFIPKDRSVGLVPTACKVASGGAEHITLVKYQKEKKT